MKNVFLLIIAGTVLYSCSSTNPYAGSNKKYKLQAKQLAKIIRSMPADSLLADSMKIPLQWVGTTNFGLRKPSYVIIHHTAQKSCEQTLKTFTLERTSVSSHYVICEDGTLHHMLNDYLRAWHAGNSKWGGMSDINSSSIGIEIDNDGTEVFTEAQLNVLLGLLAKLKKTHGIPAANFIGHSDIAPGRKVDPNVNFPWKRLADNGFGLWYGDTTNVIVPATFDSKIALRIIGYNISNYENAVEAFRRHFISVDAKGDLSEAEKKVLYVLMGKYL
ncbi:MAG: N-acetylmuramoyl-L-alanine amidase [Sphingobacteriales bacterium]|nr:MAG: N-acetylmuramoyl-L-alanine amidase [Sphingobacteriales bacterium]